MENLKTRWGRQRDRERRESGTRMLMLAYGGRQGGGDGGSRSVWELRGKKERKKTERSQEDYGGGTIRVAEVEKFLRRRSLASVRPSCPLSHVVSLLFLSGGRQQINGGRRCARRLWKKDQPRMLLCSRNSSDRPAKSWACTGASALFRLPSLRKAVCLSFIYLFIYLGSVSPHPPSSPSISWCKAGEG